MMVVALAMVAQHKSTRKDLKAAVGPILALIEVAEDSRVLGNLAGALTNMARHKANKLAIIEGGGAKALAALLTRSTDTQIFGKFVIFLGGNVTRPDQGFRQCFLCCCHCRNHFAVSGLSFVLFHLGPRNHTK